MPKVYLEASRSDITTAQAFMAAQFPAISVGSIDQYPQLTRYNPRLLRVIPLPETKVPTHLIVAKDATIVELRSSRVTYTIGRKNEVFSMTASPQPLHIAPDQDALSVVPITLKTKDNAVSLRGNVLVVSTGSEAERVYPVEITKVYGFIGFAGEHKPMGILYNGAVLVEPVINK